MKIMIGSVIGVSLEPEEQPPNEDQNWLAHRLKNRPMMMRIGSVITTVLSLFCWI